MKKTTALYSILAAISAFPGASAWGRPLACDMPGLESELIDLSENLLQDFEIPGVSFAVGGEDGVIFAGGAGVADRETGRKADASTIYQIGSVTKMFSGTAFASLVSEDRVSLATPLREAWPEGESVPSPPKGVITLQHVATHTGGLPRYPSNLDRIDGDPIRGFSDAELLEGLSLSVIDSEPGTTWEYSNFGYGVLSHAVYQLIGQHLEEVIEEKIATPLALKDTSFQLRSDQKARLATPYRDDETIRPTVPWEMGSMSAAGALYSTVIDLVTYGSWELTGFPTIAISDEARFLARAPLHRFSERPEMAYGIGRFIMDDWIEGRDVIWHGGDVDGYAGASLILSGEGLTFAYLVNRGIGRPLGPYQKQAIEIILKNCAER